MLIAQGGANPIELSTNGVVRVYIKDDGNVGIGTTAPGYKLDVSGGSIRAMNDHTFNIDDDTNQIVASGLTDPNMRVYMGYDTTGNYGYIQSHWRTHQSTPLVLQPSVGNVGIGTVAPTSKLQVVGLPTYANNAAALTGGLTAGAFYRTGGDPDPVCVVH